MPSLQLRIWLRYIRPGDWLVLVVGLAITIASLPLILAHGQAEKVIIKLHGKTIHELNINRNTSITVAGPIGQTVIEIHARKVRVASDPGPRQYCVKQGWLSHAGAIAICAPNEISVQISGQQATYDSLNY